MVALLFTPVTALSQTPGVQCDIFKQRLVNAGNYLEFQLPPLKIERAPVTKYDSWWFSYPGGESGEGYQGGLNCKYGRFDEFWIDVDSVFYRRSHPTLFRSLHLISAGLYALTGWAPLKIIDTVSSLLRQQPTELAGKPVSIEVAQDTFAELWFVQFSISVSAQQDKDKD